MKQSRLLPLHYMMCALCALLAACNDDAHENEYPLASGQGAFIVGLHSGTAVEALTLYFFGDAGDVVLRKDYTDPRILASEYLPVKADAYTIVAVANADAALLPGQTTPADLVQLLKDNLSAYPDMLTASVQSEVRAGEINRALLELQDGTDGLALSAVRLLLTVPGKQMPDYTLTRAVAGETTRQLRCVAEVRAQGTDNLVHRRTLPCTKQADGSYLAELSLLEGDYDLRLWTDWNGDYYATEDLTAVTVRAENYIAGTITDTKDAYYATATISVSESTEETAIELTRPFARYRLVATDVEGYNRLVEKEDYPPIENLEVRVGYEGFFPTGFDVATGKPNDALTGIFYTTVPVGADGFDKAEALQVGGDFVLTNGEESFVTSTVEIIDRTTGETVSRTAGVKIPYRRGHLTTVTGHFLTAGKTTGGVQIDTGWEDEIIVEF